MTQRYIVETVNNAWSYINGPQGYREGPYRYRWEAEEYAEKLERGEVVQEKCSTTNQEG